jgi:hypothetical protein
MAKKATAKKTEVAPQEKTIDTIVKEAPVAKKAPVIKQPIKPSWEIKDRLYTLKNGMSPLVYTVVSRHSARRPLLWFDESTGEQKELRYATNQNSPLVEEQKGQATLGRIVFRDGVLAVPKEKQNLQKLLSIYHPLKDKVYEEYNPVQESVNELDYINLEIEALMMARDLDIDQAEAIMRVEQGNKVDSLSSSELKRDLLIFAKRNPGLFIELANDENVELRNIGIKATSMGIIQLSSDQRTFTYGETKRKLMTVPFDEHPYSALAAYFKTDDGMEVYKNIMKRL